MFELGPKTEPLLRRRSDGAERGRSRARRARRRGSDRSPIAPRRRSRPRPRPSASVSVPRPSRRPSVPTPRPRPRCRRRRGAERAEAEVPGAEAARSCTSGGGRRPPSATVVEARPRSPLPKHWNAPSSSGARQRPARSARFAGRASRFFATRRGLVDDRAEVGARSTIEGRHEGGHDARLRTTAACSAWARLGLWGVASTSAGAASGGTLLAYGFEGRARPLRCVEDGRTAPSAPRRGARQVATAQR